MQILRPALQHESTAAPATPGRHGSDDCSHRIGAVLECNRCGWFSIRLAEKCSTEDTLATEMDDEQDHSTGASDGCE